MEADWFVDPLGRYEGRFFDGERWTARVSDRGVQSIDPDWVDPEPPPAVAPLFDPTPATGDDDPATPQGRLFDYSTESPARRVAEVDGSAPGEAPLDAQAGALATGAAQVVEIEPAIDAPNPFDAREPDAGQPESRRRILFAVGLAVVIAGLLLAVLPRILGGGDEVADDSGGTGDAQVTNEPDPDPDPDTGSATEPAEARPGADEADADADTAAEPDAGDPEDEDPETSDSSDTADAGDTDTVDPFAPPAEEPLTADAVVAGSLQVLNGVPVMEDLAIWHASTLVDRDIELDADAACWLGVIGTAVVQNAHCGPVSVAGAPEPLYDVVPLEFEDVEPGVIQVRPITDDVVIDQPLAPGLDLVDRNGVVEPPAGATRGERADG